MTNVKILTLFAILAIASVSTSQVAFGTFLGGTFTSPTQKYYCTSDLDNDIIVSLNVDTCGDLAYAAGKWNAVGTSNWDFTENPTSTSSNINVWTAPLGFGVLGLTQHVPCTTCNPYTDADVWFSTQYPYGDISQGDSSVYYDYESIAIHEFGHVPGIGHNTNSASVMYASIGAGVEKETLHSSDISDIGLLY